MKRSFPIVAAIGLTVLWGVMLFAIPITLLQLPDLHSEMATGIWRAYIFLGKTVLPLLVLATALLLGFRQFVGWVYAVVLCVAWDLAFVGLLLPTIDNIKMGTIPNSSFFLLPAFVSVQTALIILAFVLNQALFVSLVVKRREFAR